MMRVTVNSSAQDLALAEAYQREWARIFDYMLQRYYKLKVAGDTTACLALAKIQDEMCEIKG